ncbi:MAG: PhaM family polyhydroxyalkanoate granule multifunctional regulatory protein [Betaproteobacteria bacterium]
MADDFGSKDLMDFFQKMWNPMSFPIPGMFQPTMDAAEVEKKIAELQAVETWLNMNLSFLQMTIKTLQMQKTALDALHETAKAAGDRNDAA